MTQAIRLNPYDGETYRYRGDLYLDSDYDKALADFTQAILLNPQDSEAYHHRSGAYRLKGGQTGEYDDQALADNSEAIRIEPKWYFYITRAQLYQKNGAYDRAVADYDEALRRSPNNTEAQEGRQRAYQRTIQSKP